MATLQGNPDWLSGVPNEAVEQRPVPVFLRRSVTLLFFFSVSWLLAFRQLGTAFDDSTNLTYFDGLRVIDPNSNWWQTLIEEPVWTLWTGTMGNVLGNELAMRLTILLSSIGLLWSANRLSKGAWAFILLIFILSEPLATQLYFNQIRQGVALSLFLAGLMRGTRPSFVLAGVAMMIHSSLIFGFLALVLSFLTRRLSNRNVVFFSVATVIVMIAIKSYVNLELFIDLLGRRSGAYAFERATNVNFYILSLLVFSTTMYATQKLGETDLDGLLWRLTWYYYCLAFILSFYYEASGRLFYALAIFYPILIARRFPRRFSIYAVFVMCVVASSAWSQVRYGVDTVFSKWDLILYGGK